MTNEVIEDKKIKGREFYMNIRSIALLKRYKVFDFFLPSLNSVHTIIKHYIEAIDIKTNYKELKSKQINI